MKQKTKEGFKLIVMLFLVYNMMFVTHIFYQAYNTPEKAWKISIDKYGEGLIEVITSFVLVLLGIITLILTYKDYKKCPK